MRSNGAWATIVAAAALSVVPACGGGGGGSAGSGNPALVDLITSSMPTGTTGVWYEVQLDAEFPNPPGLYLVVGGALPPGLTLDRQVGLISGYPRAVGNFTFTIAARDGNDPDLPPGRDANFAEDRQQFTLQVFRGPPHILPQVVPSAQYRAPYSYFIDIAGGTPPYTWSLSSGTLPTGVELNAATGELCCFPSSVNPDLGNPPFQFQVTATDSGFPVPLQDTANLELQVVVLPLTIATTSPMVGGAKDFPYDQVFLLASAGAGAPYVWAQSPPIAGETDLSTLNLTITADGHLKNVTPPGPNSLGTYLFTAQVIDEAGQFASRQYSITFSEAPFVTSISPTKSSTAGPFTITGLNFQPGATVIFKPGATQNSPANVAVLGPTTITFPTAPPPPGGIGGYVTVRVRNPDGGYGDLPNGFAFPAASLTFNATGAFPATQTPLSSTGLHVGDVNKDGFADIVHSGTNAGNWGVAVGTAGGVDLLINAPAGGVFNAASPAFNKIQLAIGGDWHGVKLADVNTDGWLDVVATGNIGGIRLVRTWLNNGSGGFTAGLFTSTSLPSQGNLPPYNLTNVTDMALGRFDSDGAPDLVYAYQDGWDFSTGVNSGTTSYGYHYSWYQVTGILGGSVQAVKGMGNGAFSSLNLTATGRSLDSVTSVGAVGMGRFDGDARLDVAVGDAAGAAMSWNYGVGDQSQLGKYSLTQVTNLFGSWNGLSHPAGGVVGGSVMSVVVGDINGDLRDDVVFPEEASFAGTFASGIGGTPSLASYAGNGSGSFSELPILKPASRLRHATLLDGDFDAAQDIAATGGTGAGTATGTWNRIEIFKGRTGTLGPQARQTITQTTGSPNFGEIASGDVSGDGRPDLVATMSFYHPDIWTAWNMYNYGQTQYYAQNWQNRGNGGTMGVIFFYNTSQ